MNISKNNRIYIAGCAGMLGDAFYKIFSQGNKLECSDINVNEPWVAYLDFRDYEEYKGKVYKFTV